MRKIIQSQKVKDVLLIITLIIIDNLYTNIAYDTLQYLNTRKVIWALIVGLIIFVPMYFVLWISLRKLKSKLYFVIFSISTWCLYPILTSQGRSSTFNAWQGQKQIYENGQLTTDGFVHKLQNPFMFLAAYAVIIFSIHFYLNRKKLLGKISKNEINRN
jgi:hypothetical protein